MQTALSRAHDKVETNYSLKAWRRTKRSIFNCLLKTSSSQTTSLGSQPFTGRVLENTKDDQLRLQPSIANYNLRDDFNSRWKTV